jgi:hypothetical protein
MTAALQDEPKGAILLAALRCARIRVTLLGLEIEEVGIALKYRMVSPEYRLDGCTTSAPCNTSTPTSRPCRPRRRHHQVRHDSLSRARLSGINGANARQVGADDVAPSFNLSGRLGELPADCLRAT